MSEFLRMGGYAFYVWTSYGLAFVLMTALVVSPLIEKKRLIEGIRRKLRRERREK